MRSSLVYSSVCIIGSRVGMGVKRGNLLVMGMKRYILISSKGSSSYGVKIK